MSSTTRPEGLTLVLGATGKTGRRVVQRLREKGHAIRNASLGDGVQKALGREPLDFADFCRAAATSGVWNVA